MTRSNQSRFISSADIGAVVGFDFGAVDQASVRFAAKVKAREEAEERVRDEQARQLGFADGYPYLLVGQGSLDTLNARLAQPVTARHFRPNLVVADTQPYEEDDWTVIQIGEVVFDVVKPCTRCILTTVNPATGIAAADGEPMTTLMRDRLFDDGVHFGQNLVPRNTGTLAVGMPVEVLE